MNQQKGFKHLDTISVLFVTALMTSNLLSSAKLVDTKFFIGSTALIFDGGLLIFPFSYIFCDILTEVYGFKASRKIIWLGFAGYSIMCFFTYVLKLLPGESSWLEAGGQTSYDLILFGLSSGVLLVASLSAYLVGEFSNSIILAKLKVIQKGKFSAARFVASTMAGQLLDTLIFFGITTIGGIFDSSLFISLVLTNYIIKVLLEIVMLPFSIKLSNYLKKTEHSDVYDYKTKFNPFII